MKNRNIPFGYQYRNGIITLQPSESKTVRTIYADYLQGNSLLQIAKDLNSREVEYMPGVTGWNKARIKRLIEDERYLGNETYPSIIERDAFSRAQKLKAERNTQKAVDRSTEVFHMTIPVTCGECGQPMRRKHDRRYACSEKWICQSCGAVTKICDSDLFQAITDCLNIVIAKPKMIIAPCKCEETFSAACRLKNEIGRMLDSPNIDREKLKNKIFECASQVYAELDTAEYITDMLKAAFEKSKPLSCYNRTLAKRTVEAFILYADKSVGLILKNGQTIRKEQPNATDASHTAETGTHHSAVHTAGEYPKYNGRPQACGGILPRLNTAGGTA